MIDFTTMGIERYFWFTILVASSFIVGNLLHMFIRKRFDKKLGVKNSKILARITQYMIILICFEFGLYFILGVGFGSLLTTLGVASVIIGIASQQIIQNFIAGIIISIERPIEVEDWIEVGGLPATGLGRVREIGLMRTNIRDLDGELVYVPNSLLVTNKIVNYTTAGFTKDKVRMTFKTNSDFVKIKKAILHVVRKNDRILPNVSKVEQKESVKLLKVLRLRKLFERKVDLTRFEPRVVISDLVNGRMTVEVEYWHRDVKHRKYIRSELLRKLSDEFKKKRISVV